MEFVRFESKPVVFHSNVKSENVPENVKQIDIMHRRLGHPNKQVLIKVMSSCNQFKGMNKECSMFFCSTCMHEKSHKLHHSSTPNKTAKPLELVHTDLWEPIPMSSNNGCKYYMSVVDDNTR